MTNLETAAHEYAKQREASYIAKRGGAVPVRAAHGIYVWAFNRFIANPAVADRA